MDQPVSRTAGGTTVYYLQDHAGSVSALADSSGAILGRYWYSPWGELVSQDAGLPTQPLKWTGRELDETGLYYLRGRYYHPGTGRFLSEDPAGLAANLNLYTYALNAPVGMRDPFGLDASNLNVGGGMSWLDGLQTGLDIAGLIPGLGEIADGANGLISLGRGNYGDAALSFGAMIPFAGAAATAAKLGRRFHKAADAAKTAANTECFPAGTAIATRFGEKPIEQIRPGDEVLSADAATGKQSYQKVVRTFVRQSDELLKVVTEDGRSIEATPEHPFWVKGKGFVAAKKLARSDLLKDRYGRYVAVIEVTPRRGAITVYNFEVERTHTYYAGSWWVHNTCDPFHHIFPQNRRMARYFAGAGIDVHDFTVQLPQDFHDILHWPTWRQRGGYWVKEWDEFIKNNPQADFMKVWNKADEMVKNFGLENMDFVRYPSK